MSSAFAANGVNLDLTSGNTSLPASGALGRSASATIQIGNGRPTTITQNSGNLTPAEYLAVLQVVSGTKQSIQIGSSGAATGGSFLTSSVSNLSSLVIPQGVKAFDTASNLSLSGNLSNSGTLYALATGKTQTTDVISALNISNAASGLITLIAPVGTVAGSALSSNIVGLSLSATNTLTNYGTISSSGALNLSAGTSIINSSQAGSTAVMQAATTLAMSAPNITNSGNIVALTGALTAATNALNNSGLIQASQSTMSLTAMGNGNHTLDIINTGGTLSSALGTTINFGNNGAVNQLTVTGGTFDASTLILSAGNGTVDVSVDSVPQSVRVEGKTINFAVDNGTHGLQLSSSSGLDSLTYKGTGNVSFAGSSTNGGAISVDTTGSISVTGSSTAAAGNINTTQSSGDGGAVSLVAGGTLSVGNINTAGAGSGNGGAITLSAGGTLGAGSLNASGGFKAGNPGVITISSQDSSSRSISVGSITDSGATGSAGGSVSITTPGSANINGDLSAPGAAVSLSTGNSNIKGTVNVAGGSVQINNDNGGQDTVNFSELAQFGGANVQVGGDNYTQNIVVDSYCLNCLGNVNSVVFDTKGTFSSTGQTIQLNSNANLSITAQAGITTGTISGGKSVTMSTQGNLIVGGSLSATGAVTLSAGTGGRGGDLTVGSGNQLTGSSITLSTNTGNIYENGSLTATAGSVNISAGGDLNMSKAAVSASSGNISMSSGGNISIGNGSSLSATDGNVVVNATGNVNLTGVQLSAVSSSQQSGSTLPSYSGGAIVILAGVPSTNVNDLVASLVSSRSGSGEGLTVTGGNLDASNAVNESGGSVLNVVFPAGGSKTVTNNTFNLSGGVMYIDPPAGNSVTINGSTISASGPQLINTTGTGGTGSVGGTGGTGTGTGAGLGSGGGSVSGAGLSSGSTDTLGLTISGSTSSSTANSSVSSLTGSDTAGISSGSVSSSILPIDSTPVPGVNTGSTSAAVYCAPLITLRDDQALDDNSWIIAANACQPFSFEGPDGSIIIGTGPATFAPAPHHTLLLKEGKLLIIASNSVIVVRTPMCNVSIPINSAATVDYDASGVTRLTAFAGGKTSVTLNRSGETMVLYANAGEQLVLAEAAVPDSSLACMPPVPNEKMDNWMIRMNGVRGIKFSFDLVSMVSQEGLLNCTLGCFSKTQQSMIDQIRRSMLTNPNKELKSTLPPRNNAPMSNPVATSRAAKGSHLLPVAFSAQPVLESCGLTTITSAAVKLHYTEQASVSLAKDRSLALRQGELLVATTAPTKVFADGYCIGLDTGSIALVANRGDHIVVRELFNAKQAPAMVVTADKRSVGAAVGQELIIGKAGYSFAKVLGEDAVGRRRMRHIDMGAHTNVISCEVSLVSLLENTEILSRLSRSQSPEDRAIVNKILKTAVALSIVTQSHGPYSIVGR
jgi:hypothetical protein